MVTKGGYSPSKPPVNSTPPGKRATNDTNARIAELEAEVNYVKQHLNENVRANVANVEAWSAKVAEGNAAIERADKAEARCDRFQMLLKDVERALESLPESALGRDPAIGYPYRNELLRNIRAELKDE